MTLPRRRSTPPRRSSSGSTRTGGTTAYFAYQFEKVFGLPLDRAWSRLDRFRSTRSRRRTSRRSASTPSLRTRTSRSRALGSVSRAYLDPPSARLYVGLQLPRRVAHVAIDLARRRRGREDPRGQGPADSTTVTSLAFDPDRRSSSTRPTTGHTATSSSSIRDTGGEDAARGRAHRRPRVRPAPIGRSGASATSTASPRSCASRPLHAWTQVVLAPVRRGPLRPRRLPRRHRSLSAVVRRDRRPPVAPPDEHRVPRSKGDATASRTSTSARSAPVDFVFAPDGRHLYGSSYYTGVSNIFRYDLATGKLDAVDNAETGFFRPVPPTTAR